MALDKENLRERLAGLASQGVLVGTSSWKYPGWLGMVYDEARYLWRGKFAKSRFEKDCLAEYAQLFKTVCVDAAYYTFPSRESLEALASQVPADFQFAFKVTDEITVKRFPDLPRFAQRAGTPNPNFLNGDIFQDQFLEPCQSIRSHVGLLIFEFSRFHIGDFQHGRDFVSALDAFLDKLPKGWPYGIEMRNQRWLRPEYFACLARHKVTHVFNSWTEMPTVAAQLALPDSRPNPELVAARFLLTPGRKYAQAVQDFSPYASVKETDQNARNAGAALILEGKKSAQRKTFLLVNNRLEGNAPHTIQAMLDLSIDG